MPNLEWVFYGFTLYDLLLSLGRFLIAVTGSLLALHNLLWLVRCKWRRDPRAHRSVRAVLELVIGATLGGIYAGQIMEVWRTGAAAALAPGETLVVVWAFAVLSTGLLLSAMTEQSTDRVVREHHHAHDLQEHHHEHEHRDRQE